VSNLLQLNLQSNERRNSVREFPDTWRRSELGIVAKWGSGGTPKSGTTAYYGGEIPWAVIGDLTETWVSETTQTITKAGLEKSSAKMIEPGTVMLAMYGASIGRTGIAAVKMATNQAIAFAVVVEGVIDNQYLLKYLQSQKEAFVRAGQGGAQPNISQTVIKPWPIPVPPIAEQKRIVGILEEQISRLDAALVSVRSMRSKAANLRRSLLHAAFTGSLTGHDTSTGSIPGSWKQGELGKVAKWGSGGTPKSGTPAFYGGEIPWAVIGDLTESWVSETAQTITRTGLEMSSAKIIEPGTVMLAMYGASIGRTGIAAVKMATNQAIAFAVAVDGVIDNQYLLKYLQSQKEFFVRAGQGGAQPNISQTVIKPWPIPVPPIAEQKRIVEILEEQLSRLDAALAVADAIERKTSSIRRSLLHAAFTGELTKEWREGAHV
jgi:type I restriction enzyme S subunit